MRSLSPHHARLPTVQIVWFKRDLRAHDHLPLVLASEHGAVLPLYVIEPEQWAQPDSSARHWAFAAECLAELNEELTELGQPLVIRRGSITEVLRDLRTQFRIVGLWSHEETGNNWSYQRDKRVAAWCREAGIEWHQVPQHGVQRALRSRSGWAKQWDQFMARPVQQPPQLQPQLQPLTGVHQTKIPSSSELGLKPDPCPERQAGGRSNGLERLHSFLHERGRIYRRAMSNPVSGALACSRLSPHLAYGSVSLRETTQIAWNRQLALKMDGANKVSKSNADWQGALTSFTGRLHWHCHFIQKLEDEPELEFKNLHRAYDGMRPQESDTARLEAWCNGETGLPFVDACMRSLNATGWLNFRMRAMVMAVASYHLWLDWRKSGEHLARQFTDYEPGIHWSQVQMQSGTTGINTARIYNPIKQGHDQDPKGSFVRRWVPELQAIPSQFIHEPWKADNAGSVLGKLYPEPVVNYLEAAKEARARIWSIRKNPSFRPAAQHIQNKHGSRKSGIPMRGQRKKKTTDDAQFNLPLD